MPTKQKNCKKEKRVIIATKIFFDLEKHRRDTHKNQMDELKDKILNLTQAEETSKSNISVA